MSKWKIRKAKKDDQKTLKSLWAYCFHRDGSSFTEWYFNNYYNREETILVENEMGVVVGSTQLIRLKLKRRAKTIDVAYVVGVNCFPEYRGLGAVGAMMHWILANSGEKILYLMPFEAGFYLPLGFVFVEWHGKISLPLAEIIPLSKRGDYSAERIDLNGINPKTKTSLYHLLNEVYESWQKRYFAYFSLRNHRRWSSIIEDLCLENGHCVVFKNKWEEPVAYLLYRMAEGILSIRELAYLSSEEQAAVYYYMAAHRSQTSTVEWSAPLNESFVRERHYSKNGIELEPFLMCRLVDPAIAAFYARRAPRQDIVLEIVDETLGCKHRMLWPSGSDRLIDTTNQPDISMKMDIFNRMVFGVMNSADILEHEDTEVHDMGLFNELICLFSQENIYINEYF